MAAPFHPPGHAGLLFPFTLGVTPLLKLIPAGYMALFALRPPPFRSVLRFPLPSWTPPYYSLLFTFFVVVF